MKNISLLCLSLCISIDLIAVPSLLKTIPQKQAHHHKIQINFYSEEQLNINQKNSESSQELEYCFNMLKNFADIQKKRLLTVEEILMILQVTMLIYMNNTDELSQKIEIILNDEQKLILPYSAHIFSILTQQNNTQT